MKKMSVNPALRTPSYGHYDTKKRVLLLFKPCSMRNDCAGKDDLRDHLSYARARVTELEEMVAERDETIARLVEGDTVEWDLL